ncbi:MAG: diaminopimelate decarboxylase, partial [Bacteroidota bacterium]
EIDNFAIQRPFPHSEAGDILAILHAGAYGFSMASSYNSRYRPAEVLVQQNESRLVRKRECFEDLIKGQIWDKKPEKPVRLD